MPSLRDYRRRIRGVRNTQQITHAMELVAATKMRRATTAASATRRYAALAWNLLHELQARSDVARHPLLEVRSPVRRTLLFVVAGNRGLVGAFNQRLVALAQATIRRQEASTDVVVTGRAAVRLLRRARIPILADVPKKDLLATPADAGPVADLLLQRFRSGEADRVQMISADVISGTRSEPRVRTLLPIGASDGRGMVPPAPFSKSRNPEFLFEPSPAAVVTAVVPNLVAIQIIQALLETTAAEHAARMVAMHQATRNADELVDELILTLNQVRQQQVTRELQEIVSGGLESENGS